ncbi:ABC transporter ATP-binding protein [Conexibacter sp. JD483]|uniref:ABC transporter ATP-binding protein n=1 Tax=unclassified Conexibacter TaxID=2627773 RepID=UPI0027229541|nr:MULTISPECIES: ABC transporter ATP-binding protein [unclassified Conexibacter]MDO8186570.1 ABC transporter ATP-binding protein [Conexibacter sp. CPCC 205706]MDO8196675.1 ABC transporter ATP-binding protein [Conexibacter sp. CPCC 205762]MDR9372049.1 ABC transporter ATP-binding protein [Conexibacter sp. JD483]
MTPALTVEGLTVVADGRRGSAVEIVRDVSFTVARGARMGLVGESGSGKTMTAMAVMGLLRRPLRVSGGSVLLGDTDLRALRGRALARVRGGRVAMIYQDPMQSLNPLHRVGEQIAEAIRLHAEVGRREAMARAVELLTDVGIDDPAVKARAYPHELSGGMRQRVMIAMALAADPELLLCDEPTTALDVTTQRRIVELLVRISRERGVAMVMITHDLGVAAGFCDEIAVMYAGRLVEQAPVRELYAAPRHPYTEALLGAACDLTLPLERPIPTIAGQPPLPGRLAGGCSFHPRCPYAQEVCTLERPLLAAPDAAAPARVACHFALTREKVRHG